MRRVEFDDAVKLALERNPTVADAAAAIASADASLGVARALTRPSLYASVNNVTLDKQRGFTGGVTQPRNQFSFGASASVPLLQALRWADVSSARDQVELATKNEVEVRRQVATSTAQAYLAVIAAQRQVEVDMRALEAARAHLEYADKRLEGGVGSRLNQLRAAQAVSDDQTRLENTRLGLRRAQEALGVLLAENGPVDAGNVPVFEQPAPGAESEWMTARPDLAAQAVAIRAAERRIQDAQKAWLPTASMSFDPQYITPTSLFQPARTWRLVFSVSQPVFQSGVKAEKARRQAVFTQAQLTRTSIEIQARSEIRIAEEAVQSQERALTSARLAAEQAAEVLKISTAAFEVGATTNLEVIDAQRSARDAETAAALAEDAVRRARLDLLLALGRFPR
jgi:outer membrane protein TolC